MSKTHDAVTELITPAQIRAGRALIGWKQVDLAKASGVSEITIKKIERGKSDPRNSTIAAIRSAFDSAGIFFLGSGDCTPGGPGVRLKPGYCCRDGRPGHDGKPGMSEPLI
jgi:DNA-binding XRE family transcriptional regulator